DKTLEAICKNFKFDRAIVMLKDANSKELSCGSFYGIDTHKAQLLTFRVDISQKRQESFVMSSVYHTGNPIILNDINQHLFQLNEQSRRLIQQLQSRGFIMVQIPGESGPWGVL